MLLDKLKNYNVVLASNSPRRKELLADLGIDFVVRVKKDIDESYPHSLPAMEIAEHISRKKAIAYKQDMAPGEIVITADTVVILGNEVLGKPANDADAGRMLGMLSGKTHKVVTGVTITTAGDMRSFSVQGWRLRHTGMDRLHGGATHRRQLLQRDGTATTPPLHRTG